MPPRNPEATAPDDDLREAVALHRRGEHEQAEGLYRSALCRTPGDPVANHNLGDLLLRKGLAQAALPHFLAALEADPSHGRYWISYAGALIQAGRSGEAGEVLELGRRHGLADDDVELLAQRLAATVRDPDTAAACAEPSVEEVQAAVRLVNGGDFPGAETLARAITTRCPAHAFGWKLLGTALMGMGRVAEALPPLHKAVALAPEQADAWNDLGIAFKGQGRADDAAAAFRSALRIAPESVQVLGNLGVVLHGLGRLAEAEECYRRLLALDPGRAEVHSNLAAILHNLGRAEEAVASYRRAVALAPQLAEAHHDLGNTLKVLGRLAEAEECFRQAQRLGFNDAQVKAALMLPAIMESRQEVLESRSRFERNLDRLIADRVAIEDPLRNIGETCFYLAYHGLNDRDLQVKLARYYGQACPSLLQVAAHCEPQANRRPGRLRVGFLSKFLYRHSVSLCFSRIITQLSASGEFEVSLISSEAVDASLYPGFAGRTVRIEHDLALARKAIAWLELDILVYLDIGMEPLGYFLAFARLAREQCVFAGHPVTTGIATVDHFVSVASMEPEDARDHYSERLVQLPRPLAYFERPVAPQRLLAREELGLPPDRHIYLCPMKLQKMHPDFDAAISDILAQDGKGVVVLFGDDVHAYWQDALVARFARTVGQPRMERILFLPWMKGADAFYSAIAAADVVLDPFHFGLGTTSAVIAAAATPLVTLAGRFMRGRVGAHYCRMLGIEECIAHGADEYVRIAVAIASDGARRARLADTVRNNSDVLFQGFDAGEVLAGLLRSFAADATQCGAEGGRWR